MTYTELFRCEKCCQVYPIVPYFKAAAPHGPNKDCRSKRWIKLTEDEVANLHDLQAEDPR